MTLADSLDFHHIGVACESIAPEMATWAALGYRLDGSPLIDHAQGIRGQFVVGNGPRLELLEPIGDSSTLAPWLKRRTSSTTWEIRLVPSMKRWKRSSTAERRSSEAR